MARKADDYTVVQKFNDQSQVRMATRTKVTCLKTKKGVNRTRSNAGSHTKIGSQGANNKNGNYMNPKDDNMWCDIHKNKSHSTNNCRLLPDLQAHGYKASENKKIRMCQNIHRSCTCQWQVGVALKMSYFGSRHGKGPADGCTE